MPIRVVGSKICRIIYDTMSDEEKIWYILEHGHAPEARIINRPRCFEDANGCQHGMYVQWIYTDKQDEEIDVDKYPQTASSPRQA